MDCLSVCLLLVYLISLHIMGCMADTTNTYITETIKPHGSWPSTEKTSSTTAVRPFSTSVQYYSIIIIIVIIIII